jgi:hypothetical protein
MLGRFGRRVRISFALMLSLGVSVLASAFGTLDCLSITAPAGVIAGLPIAGFVAGGHVPMNWSASDTGGFLPPIPPTYGAGDPVYFFIPTFEPMRGSVVTINASDPTGATATETVRVW